MSLPDLELFKTSTLGVDTHKTLTGVLWAEKSVHVWRRSPDTLEMCKTFLWIIVVHMILVATRAPAEHVVL